MVKNYTYSRISQSDYDKIFGQFRLQLNAVFEPFRTMGLDVYIPGAIETTVALAELASERVRGRDTPITIEKASQRIKKRRVRKSL